MSVYIWQFNANKRALFDRVRVEYVRSSNENERKKEREREGVRETQLSPGGSRAGQKIMGWLYHLVDRPLSSLP